MEYDATPDNDKTGLNEDLIDLGSSIVTADEIAANPGLYDLAANQDENKELEAETPRE